MTNFTIFLYFVALSLLVSAIAAGKVNFIDCGKNEIYRLSISNCTGSVCIFHREWDYQIESEFVANQNSSSVELQITAKVDSEWLPVPGIDSDACNHMKCPMVKNETIRFYYELTIAKLMPFLKAEVYAQLVGENGIVNCVRFQAHVKP